ncbi:MAG: cytochrome c, partial [Thermoguttaceae bacterium]|nr:cytochrome c [Thermoguttaceae bacterium]
GGVLALNRLPQFWHAVFSSRRFKRVTTDGFFLGIEADDPRFDESSTRAFLETLGARSVETCYDPGSGREVPKALYWIGVTAVLLAFLPPLWIARSRATTSTRPRIHPIQDMDFQPRYHAQGASPLFDDRRAMRPPVAGTIARGELQRDEHLVQGTVGGKPAETFPLRVSQAMIERGRQRYEIYCATCHGLDGDGKGPTAIRALERAEPGWVAPRSLHADAVRQQPVGQLFRTITRGLNTMPSYAAQIAPEDRWAIVLYVRALQRSQNARMEDVPPEMRSQVQP